MPLLEAGRGLRHLLRVGVVGPPPAAEGVRRRRRDRPRPRDGAHRVHAATALTVDPDPLGGHVARRCGRRRPRPHAGHRRHRADRRRHRDPERGRRSPTSTAAPHILDDPAAVMELWQQRERRPRQAPRPARARRHAVRRAVRARPPPGRPARARRRHDRRRQERVPAGVRSPAWPRCTARSGSRSCSSTTRAARRSRSASSCPTPSAWSPTSTATRCAGRSSRSTPSCTTASCCCRRPTPRTCWRWSARAIPTRRPAC